MNQLATTDTFGPTLNNLKNTLKDFAPLVEPIDGITTVVTDIDDALVAIGDIITAASDIDDLIIILGEVLEFLDGIPIIGEVAEVISVLIEALGDSLKDAVTSAQEINTSTIKPVVETLGEVKAGLKDVRVVVVDISQKVPGYINTVEILHYLSEIAEPLTAVLQGTASGDKLHDLLATFNKVQQDLGTALSKLNPVITGVDDGVKALTTVIDDVKNAMGGDITALLDGIKSAAKGLAPISNGFHRVEDAIKPVAWILDALACIFDTILEPIIDLILDATGLRAVVNSAEEAIFKKLGISSIMNMSASSFNKSSINDAKTAVGAKQGADYSRAWDLAETALGQYRSGKDGGTKAAILGLISAITNTPIDPGKASSPPPFMPPSTPALSPADSNSGNTTSDLAFYTPRKINHIDLDLVEKLKKPELRVYSRSLVFLAKLNNSAPKPLPKIDGAVWPKSALLIANIKSLTASLDLLVPDAAQLEGSLTEFEASLVLPTTFAQQAHDMSQLLKDAVNILDFFASLNVKFVSELVKPFDVVAHNQNDKMNAVINELPVLKLAMTNLELAATNVITNIPQTKVIDQTIHRIEGWSMSINQIIQLVIQARIRDAKTGNKLKPQIDAFAQKLEAIATSITNKVTNITNASNLLTTAIFDLQNGLNEYTISIENIGIHSTLLSKKALPIADQAVHILGIVNSIIDPLSGLLEAENCIDASNPFKIYAAAARDAIDDAGKIAATAQPQMFEEFAEKLAEEALPLTELATAVKKASDSISSNTVTAFQSQSSNLVTGLDNLSKELVQSESYTTTIKTRQGTTKIITVNNDLFNQDLLTEVNKIINAMNINP